MDIRYSAHPKDVKRYTTQELRDEFLIENLYFGLYARKRVRVHRQGHRRVG